MIKTIIFDFGGVLGSDADDWKGNFKAITELTGLSSDELDEILNNHWPNLKIGKGSVASFWQEVAARAKNRVDSDKLAKVYLSKITVNEDVLDLARELRKSGFQLVILSNESKEWMDEKIKKFPRGLFGKIYCSAYLGMAKPSAEIFTYVLKDLGVKPSDVIFIDNQENNIEVAKGLGIEGILYRNSTLLATSLSGLLTELRS